MQRIGLWAKREKQIEQVISNMAGMYGELQALAGLPDVPALTIGTGEADEDLNEIMVQPSTLVIQASG